MSSTYAIAYFHGFDTLLGNGVVGLGVQHSFVSHSLSKEHETCNYRSWALEGGVPQDDAGCLSSFLPGVIMQARKSNIECHFHRLAEAAVKHLTFQPSPGCRADPCRSVQLVISRIGQSYLARRMCRCQVLPTKTSKRWTIK